MQGYWTPSEGHPEYPEDMTTANPSVVPADTTEEIWRRQMEAVALRSPADRLAEWAALNEAVARMEADAVRRQHPEFSDQETLVELMRRRYGDALVSAACPDAILSTR